MGVYELQEISRSNYDSAQGVKPPGCYHNFWGIFLVVRTSPCINEFITQGNHKMNADRDADGLFSSALPRTCSNSALSRSVSTTYKMGKPWDKCRRTAHLNRLVSNSLQQHPVQEPHHHFYACTRPVAGWKKTVRPLWISESACEVRVQNSLMFMIDLAATPHQYSDCGKYNTWNVLGCTF